MKTNPVIILGMHRSGTTILSYILKSMGLFLGKDLNIHHESKFFIEFNNYILSISHASWDYPLSAENLFKSKISYEETIKELNTKINSIQFIRKYWDLNRVLFNNIDKNFWGWKDLRTTITFLFF
ncbi:MAG: hypothetical protein ACOCUI_05395 [bacterium]